MAGKRIRVIVFAHVHPEDKGKVMRWLNMQHTGKEQIPAGEETPPSLKAALHEIHSTHVFERNAELSADGKITLLRGKT